MIEVPEKGLLIITDYETAVAKALEIIKLVSVAPRHATVVRVALQHGDARSVSEQVSRILADKATLEGRQALPVNVSPDSTGGSLLLIGFERDVAEVRKLISELDESAESQLVSAIYSPRHISVNRLVKLVDGVGATPTNQQAGARVFADEEVNRLYVTAPPAVHQRIERLLEQEDVRELQAARPMRVYRPKHRPARDLIGALSDLLPNVEVEIDDGSKTPAKAVATVPPGPNRPPAPADRTQLPPLPPAQEPLESPPVAEPPSVRLKGKDFLLSADEHSNAILAVGTLEFHARLETILPELDRRQPQVMIEMTLVAITFNDSLSLAVELANEEKHNDTQSLIFSSFGLSQVNLNTGARRFNPGGGLNGIIMGPHETPLLFRAIAAHGNSRIITTPKIVVSDNSTATIASVEDAPFTSINASDTVATTSFAGYESAGTTLTVTPHIATLRAAAP